MYGGPANRRLIKWLEESATFKLEVPERRLLKTRSRGKDSMFTQMLVPLDGSETAEKVLPYSRYLAGKLKIPVRLLAVLDMADTVTDILEDRALGLDTAIDDGARKTENYLREVAKTFPGAKVECTVERGEADKVIMAKGKSDRRTLITMATHGRSGLARLLLGSIADKVLRGSVNPLLLVRATREAISAGEANLKTIIVPLDGSKLAEGVLPMAVAVAKALDLEVVLFRAYHAAFNPTANHSEVIAGVRDEAAKYLENMAAQVKQLGVSKVRCVTKEGTASDEILALGRETADHLIAMCSHGRTVMERWALGSWSLPSVTETVVRHANESVLMFRAE